MFDSLNFSGRKRLPLILQSENTECGLACLAMLSGYFGHQVDLQIFRENCNFGLRGASLSSVMRAATSHHFSCRAIRCEPGELRAFVQPVVLHWDFCHFVVLKKCTRKHVTIHDPAVGTRNISYEELSRHFTGVVLELTPNGDFTPRTTTIQLGIRDFLKNTHGLVPVLCQIFVLAFVLQLIALLSPFYTQLVIDEVLVKRDVGLLLILALGFGFLVLISVMTQAVRGWASIYLTSQLSFQFGASLFHHLIHLPVAFFQKRHMGDIVSRFQSLAPIQNFITSSAITVLLDGIMAISTLVVVFVYSPLLASVVLSVIVLDLASQLIFFAPIKARANEQLVAEALLDSNFMETIRSIATIKRYGIETHRISDWQNRLSETINTGINVGRLELGLSIAGGLITGISGITVIYLGAREVLAGTMSIGMLFAFIAYKTQLQTALTSLIHELMTYLMLSLHFLRLSDIKLQPSEICKLPTRQLSGAIEAKSISFRYDKDSPWIIRNLHLLVKPGHLVAIYGPSGSGKSTLLKLMQSCLTMGEGELYFDNQSVHVVGIHSLQANSASVMQEDQLFSGSIRNNIALGNHVVDWPRLENAAENAGIHQDIMNLPMAYESPAGEMGTCLSSGQAQRVLIARAFYRQPRMLFLDEGTAHLDGPSALKTMNTIRAMNITCIFVTHNKAHLALADTVVLIKDGQHRVSYRSYPLKKVGYSKRSN